MPGDWEVLEKRATLGRLHLFSKSWVERKKMCSQRLDLLGAHTFFGINIVMYKNPKAINQIRWLSGWVKSFWIYEKRIMLVALYLRDAKRYWIFALAWVVTCQAGMRKKTCWQVRIFFQNNSHISKKI